MFYLAGVSALCHFDGNDVIFNHVLMIHILNIFWEIVLNEIPLDLWL